MNNWDKYFMDIAAVVAQHSKCFSRKLGAVIVKDKSIISTGYNGPPRNVPHCGERYGKDELLTEIMNNSPDVKEEDFHKFLYRNACPRHFLGYKSGEGLDICIAGHAERNALINAARLGVSVKDATMYMNCGIPCKDCLIEIINAGIIELVVTKKIFYDKTSPYLVKYSEINIRTYGENNETEIEQLCPVCDRRGT